MLIRSALLAIALAAAAAPATALDILLGNDDGFETANVRALQQRLKAAGHDVLVAAPAQNNSGRGGAILFLKPLGPLTDASRYGSVAAGAPGVGADPADADVRYVDGTPVMALLYGLDVAAPKRWGRAPDLVLSGPNEGANLGAVVVSSGTVNNALYAINRGLPAIAVSYADFGSRPWSALAPGAIEYEIADRVVALVNQLERRRGRDGRLLPPGTGLNVNIPRFAPGTGAQLQWRLARVGAAAGSAPVFFERLADSPAAVQAHTGVDLPGIGFVAGGAPLPPGVAIPVDDDPRSEANVLATGRIAVSVLQGVPAAGSGPETRARARLRGLAR
ncbi:MAG: 5'/3'-nucleotidase SurE [Gammaproteobacteria bacterium]